MTKKIIFTSALLSCFLLETLSGCADFKEKFDANEVAWSGESGNKSLIVHGYILDKDGNKKECDDLAKKSMLMPDSKYYRDWINVYNSKLNWKSSPSKEAQSLIRYASWNEHCVYKFNNIPAGNWMVVINMQHYVKPYRTYYGTTFTGKSDIGPLIIKFAFFKINADDLIVKKDIVFNVDKIKSDGDIISNDHTSIAEVYGSSEK